MPKNSQIHTMGDGLVLKHTWPNGPRDQPVAQENQIDGVLAVAGSRAVPQGQKGRGSIFSEVRFPLGLRGGRLSVTLLSAPLAQLGRDFYILGSVIVTAGKLTSVSREDPWAVLYVVN